MDVRAYLGDKHIAFPMSASQQMPPRVSNALSVKQQQQEMLASHF